MAAWFLRLLFIALGLIGSAFATKILALGTITFSANLLLLPFILILLTLIQLAYGLRFAVHTLILSLGANLIFMTYGWLITLLPSPDFATNNVLFDPILAQPLYLILNNLFIFTVLPGVFVLLIAGLRQLNILKTLNVKTQPSLLSKSKYLSLIMVIYGVIILAANWYDPRFIKIFWFEVDSGTLVFPLTNILLDMVTEVYGYKHARLAIWCGFLFNLIILALGQITAHWPSPDAGNVLAYQHFLLFDGRILLASFISYFATEGLSAYVLAKLKILLKGRLMALRFVSSTAVGYLIDVVVFCLIAFTGLMSFKALLYIMLTSWVMMTGIEMLLLPATVFLSKKLKALEGLDIYDQNTRFTLLSLDHHYTKAHNKFTQSIQA
jgi:queuosine precursor transporter